MEFGRGNLRGKARRVDCRAELSPQGGSDQVAPADLRDTYPMSKESAKKVTNPEGWSEGPRHAACSEDESTYPPPPECSPGEGGSGGGGVAGIDSDGAGLVAGRTSRSPGFKW